MSLIRKVTKKDISQLFKLETKYIKEHGKLEISEFRCTGLNEGRIKTNFSKKTILEK